MSRRFAILTLAISTLLVAASEARGAECAAPTDRPAVCKVETTAIGEDERARPIDLNGTTEIRKGQTLTIEFAAFDQNRRRFPQERLAFDFDASMCRNSVNVERTAPQRFAITGGAAAGRCEIWFWLPGNLNFEWRFTVQLAAVASAGESTSSEADFIAQRLYQALLRRDADPQGLRDTSTAIQRGELSRRIDEMVRSDEFRTKARGAHPNWMLEQIYLGILGRKPDPSGVQAFSRKIELGQIADVVRELIASDEFKRLIDQR